MFDKYFDELQVGDRWQSRGRTITETDLVMFAAFSGDWYPLHTDKEWAAQTIFKERIAHGMLVLSVATGLLNLVPGPVVAFYGLDRVRFVRPTFIGDTVYLELELVDKSDRGDLLGLATFHLEVKDKKQETKIIATLKFLMNRKPSKN
ncbi:MAG: dehydratase [Thermoanaerobacteraceae bacterium]|nr:dehydratase [Thermoanaerobacteraceae bacterium]